MTLSITYVLDDYLNSLERDLEVELDLHGGRTILARDLRTLIVATKKEIDYINKKELDFVNKHLEGVNNDNS